MLTCSICGFKSVSSTEYVSHCRTHRHLNNVRMSCALRDCGSRFSSFNSLAVHMSRTHPERSVRQTWNRSVSVPLKCSFNYCTREYVELKQLVSHLNDHIQEGLHVVCPFDGCGRTFNVKTSLSSHISRIHRGWNTTQISSIYLSDVQARLTDSTPEESAAAALPLQSTPCILTTGDHHYKIAVDQEVVNNHISSMIVALSYTFAAFYVFNIKYPKDMALTLEFIQRVFLGINPERGSKAEKKGKKHLHLPPRLLKFLCELNSFENP
ncbi:zinc finger and BTB domain-containing protein 17-like isoform X1 [Neoarius graeffei]|uniref:zinc finger and BTB domain-containing protein 17-like isoform X1 n=1 Tax=Neoarius graeffei TaxID=443677 RepID=UPI00298CC135|nr:zinc finger and BTB domain-containing protein 17-like isoform X1 [Neoarius graeffei]XP_060773269.1 zinc finger and BTB domain-containing protein 17-like isoform X1 [Neoarius graeffei]